MSTIIVINDMPDIPKNCMSCPLIDYHREYSIVCRHYQTGDTRPSWCPLKPMPEPKNVPPDYGMMYGNPFGEGWNACLKEILNVR